MMRDYEWADADGDLGILSADEISGDAIASLELRDVKFGRMVAVYIERQHAQEIVAWLQATLDECDA